jgi:glucokinase
VTHYLGIDVGGTNVKAAVVGDDGGVKAFVQRRWSGGEPYELVSVATELADVVVAEVTEGPVACGVGCAGIVAHDLGVVRRSPNLPTWHDVRLAEMLGKQIALPMIIDNDANAAAYAEYLVGAARDATSAVVITLGTGMGAGIILNGSVYHGNHGFAGEIGHTTVDMSSRTPCACGGSGCLEPLVNAESLVSRALSHIERETSSSLGGSTEGLTARDIGVAAAEGDKAALAAVDELGRALGVGLANITALLDPEVIVIGGGVAEVGLLLLDSARNELVRRTSRCRENLPRVAPAVLGPAAGVVGAALLARDEFLR